MAIEFSDCSAARTDNSFDANTLIPQRTETLTAFIGRATRGPLNDPVIVTSFDGFRRIFGNHGPLGFLSHAVQQYFQHGGQIAAIVRIANNATRARIDLPAQGQLLRLHSCAPGSQIVLRASVDYDGYPRPDDNRFNLVVQRLARPGSQLVEDQELFRGLSMDESDERFVVDVLRASELVQLGGPLPDHRPDATRAEHPGQPLPYVDMGWPGGDGEELSDYDIVGSNDERTGIFALDDLEHVDLVNIPLLASGHDHGVTTFLAAERYCARRRATLIWDPPWAWNSVDTTLIGVRNAGLASPHAMSYFPRVCALANPERYPSGMPAGGAVAGLMAANDRSERWQDLDAGHGRLKSGLAPVVTISARQAAMLQRNGINVFTSRPPHTGVLTGNVSLVGANAVARLCQRLDRRRLLSHVLKSLEQHTRWALKTHWSREFEQRLIGQIDTFLRGLFERGAFPVARVEQAYFAKLQAAIQGHERELVVRIGIALERPGEFQVYDIVHRAERSMARPAPVLEATQLAG